MQNTREENSNFLNKDRLSTIDFSFHLRFRYGSAQLCVLATTPDCFTSIVFFNPHNDLYY